MQRGRFLPLSNSGECSGIVNLATQLEVILYIIINEGNGMNKEIKRSLLDGLKGKALRRSCAVSCSNNHFRLSQN